MGSPANIRMNVHVWILNRRPHSRPRRHVTHPLRTLLLEQRQHKLLVANIAFVNGEALFVRAHGAQTTQIGLLNAHIVIIVHLVHDDHGIAPREEVRRGRRSDEARAARDEHLLEPEVGLDGIGPARRGLGRFVVRVDEGVESHTGFDVVGCARQSWGGGGVDDAFVTGRVGVFVAEGREAWHAFSVGKLHDCSLLLISAADKLFVLMPGSCPTFDV
mmetsp:Transcript_24296/g.39495  ORF Transcript_24296/g.39495 Transcript_24296/m.39495 type:complete len:217 (+) Transcript_24296:882-1532(+)